jgi:hypothetical protein
MRLSTAVKLGFVSAWALLAAVIAILIFVSHGAVSFGYEDEILCVAVIFYFVSLVTVLCCLVGERRLREKKQTPLSPAWRRFAAGHAILSILLQAFVFVTCGIAAG